VLLRRAEDDELADTAQHYFRKRERRMQKSRGLISVPRIAVNARAPAQEATMTELLKPDICVIGAGSGGLTVAAAAAAFGVSAVLVEKGKMGGECLNTGCVPSKSLIEAARAAHTITRARSFGISVRGVDVDFEKVAKHLQEIIAAIAPNDSKERYDGLGVRVIEGAARFTDPETVAVGDEIRIKARRFVIATGSSPSLPPIPDLASTLHFTNETIFQLRARPEHLVVIGAGPVGLELGQAYRRLGCAVTVLDVATPLAREDSECVAVVLDQLAREGVVLRSNCAVVRVEGAGAKYKIVVREGGGEETISATHILVATGRRANSDELGLDHAGIRHDGGGILVDQHLRTANKRVYAIGDVVGGAQFTHLANYHAGLVVRNALFRLPVKVDDRTIPRVIFTDPELAHVGLTEAEARERRYRFCVLRSAFHENDRAQSARETHGHIKVITTRRGGILGVTIVGPAAGDLIAPWCLAMRQKLNIRAFASLVLPYPTLSEIGKRASIAYFMPGLSNRWVKRLIEFLRRFG
jgi:pyruvate/2-oxoglutarate dehydrogenase complex dihydrolipoamide dehydrogenase (E3) component